MIANSVAQALDRKAEEGLDGRLPTPRKGAVQ
jgi:hypothetical protein